MADEKSRFSIWWNSLPESEQRRMTVERAFELGAAMMEDRHHDTTELSHAYTWTCHACGNDNWQRCVSQMLNPDDPDDADVIRSVMGLSEGDPIPPGEMVGSQSYPNSVTCKSCGQSYRTTVPGDLRGHEDESD